MKHEKHVSFNGAVAHRVVCEVQQQWTKRGIELECKDKVKAKILDLYDCRTLQKKKRSKSNEAKEKVCSGELAQYFFVAHQEAQATIAASYQENEGWGYLLNSWVL